MRLLILAASYPSPEDIYPQVFVRTRVREYVARGIEVTVLNFSATKAYRLDNVPVVPLADLADLDLRGEFDVISSHAPNLRQHLRFIIPRLKKLPPIVFTFHGHETLYLHRHFPDPYPFFRSRLYPLKKALQAVYDRLKLTSLRWTISSLSQEGQVQLIYVSSAFRDYAYRDIGLTDRAWDSISQIIPNPLGPLFNTAVHQAKDTLADFITIRPLDVSRLCIDVVLECAKQNPQHTFHIYGKGRLFSYLPRPSNVQHFDHFIENDEIPALLNRYRGALMPARRDSQPVMMTEMASTGMPVVASDIVAHRETLEHFPNVIFINNEEPKFQAGEFLALGGQGRPEAATRYLAEHAVAAEISVFEKAIKNSAG